MLKYLQTVVIISLNPFSHVYLLPYSFTISYLHVLSIDPTFKVRQTFVLHLATASSLASCSGRLSLLPLVDVKSNVKWRLAGVVMCLLASLWVRLSWCRQMAALCTTVQLAKIQSFTSWKSVVKSQLLTLYLYLLLCLCFL